MPPQMRSIADQNEIDAQVDRLAKAIRQDAARSGKGQVWALVGIRSRGDVLAKRLAEKLTDLVGDRVGSLDITLYRDDLSEIGSHAVVRTTEIPFDIDQLQVVLVDDVLMTGRSIRAAIQSLMDIGRPRRVWLAVLVDRGGRELPIAPDHVAIDLTDGTTPITDEEVVEVRLKPTDDKDQIVIRRREGRR